eukprot:266310_1
MSGLDDYQCCGRMGFFCASPPISDFWYGCLAYLLFAGVTSLICYLVCAKENKAVAVYSCITGTFCLWIMWSCTWLSQWHPLIYPTYTPEIAADGGAYNGTYTACLNSTTVDRIYWTGEPDFGRASDYS